MDFDSRAPPLEHFAANERGPPDQTILSKCGCISLVKHSRLTSNESLRPVRTVRTISAQAIVLATHRSRRSVSFLSKELSRSDANRAASGSMDPLHSYAEGHLIIAQE